MDERRLNASAELKALLPLIGGRSAGALTSWAFDELDRVRDDVVRLNLVDMYAVHAFLKRRAANDSRLRGEVGFITWYFLLGIALKILIDLWIDSLT